MAKKQKGISDEEAARKVVCVKCNGTGWYSYDHNHAKKCEFCCPHDKGYTLLLEHYGENNGKLCCDAGCGHIKESPLPQPPASSEGWKIEQKGEWEYVYYFGKYVWSFKDDRPSTARFIEFASAALAERSSSRSPAGTGLAFPAIADILHALRDTSYELGPHYSRQMADCLEAIGPRSPAPAEQCDHNETAREFVRGERCSDCGFVSVKQYDPAPAEGKMVVTEEIRRLVIAARNVAFDCPPSRDALKELDAASEAFASIIPWEDEPEEDHEA